MTMMISQVVWISLVKNTFADLLMTEGAYVACLRRDTLVPRRKPAGYTARDRSTYIHTYIHT